MTTATLHEPWLMVAAIIVAIVLCSIYIAATIERVVGRAALYVGAQHPASKARKTGAGA
jgi:hypothetical protein